MIVEQWKQRFARPLHKISSLLRRWKTSEPLVGLEIGPAFIKLLKIDSRAEPYWVENFAVIPLPPGAMEKDAIKDVPAIVAAIREAFTQANIKTADIAFAIPRSFTIIKTILVNQKLNAADIESRAWVEANHHFPDLVGDIYLDFDMVGPSDQDSSQLDLLLVACRKDQVKPYLDILHDSNLNANIVDVNCYAFERALSLIMKREAALKTAALLNLDFNLSSLIVIDKGQLIYAHDHSYDGLYFKDQVQQFLDKEKNMQVSLENNVYADILKAGLSAHLRHSMHFFYSSRPQITIQKLVLSGDCSMIPFLDTLIQKETGIETVLASPLVGMEVDPKVDLQKLQQYSSSLMLCCGLALSKSKDMRV